MWNKSRVAERLNINYPIIQGPFGGGYSTPELAAAVSNAGGLGSFGAHHLSSEQIKNTVATIKKLTPRPFAMNLWVPLPTDQQLTLTPAEFAANLARLQPYFAELDLLEPQVPAQYSERFEDQIEAILEAKPPVFSFVFGIPSKEVILEMQKQNIITIGAATTPDEAQALQDSNMDLIVATGSDAGGHRPSFLKPAEESLIGTFSLIPLIVDIVDKPIIAAGGIGDGRGIVAAFALGAEGVQIGTRFLACHESGASEAHKVQLTLPSARYTALTRVFSGRYARGIPNRFMNEMKAYEADLPPYPIQNWFTQSIRRAAGLAGHSEYLSLWAGQTASLSRRQPAAESFAELVRQVEETLDRSFLH